MSNCITHEVGSVVFGCANGGPIGHARTASRESDETFVPGSGVVRSTDELAKAFTRLAEAMERQAQAIERQAQSIDTLAHVIASQYVEDNEGVQSDTYLDGTPIPS